MKNSAKTEETNQEKINSLTSLVNLMSSTSLNGGAQLSQTDTTYYNNRWYLISNNRQLLAQIYVEHGIVGTLIDQPVDDAFRPGFEIKTSEISPEEIVQLEKYAEQQDVVETLIQAIKWTRLFGGGGVLIATNQNPQTEFKIESLNEASKIEFIPVDMWELFMANPNVTTNSPPQIGKTENGWYNYYGKKVHSSRVYAMKGKEAPSFIRPRLRGWGLSAVEPLIRSLNQYLKNQDVIFEILDEAKIDVYKIKNYNQSLLNDAGTNNVAKRVQLANQLKNFQSALTMDAEDDYQQKQMTFTGLAEMLNQVRMQIASDLKMPMTKLFGLSASGFNSGEDDIENYNSMIDREVRSKSKKALIDMLSICCQRKFGFIPDDLDIEWNPLRILSAKDEEEVKDREFNRTVNGYTSGLVSSEEAKQAVNQANLLPVKLDESAPADLPIDGNYEASTKKFI